MAAIFKIMRQQDYIKAKIHSRPRSDYHEHVTNHNSVVMTLLASKHECHDVMSESPSLESCANGASLTADFSGHYAPAPQPPLQATKLYQDGAPHPRCSPTRGYCSLLPSLFNQLKKKVK